MQVRIQEVSPVEKKMFVEVPWETVSEKLGNAYRELGKGVALKGFRKGKVPRAVLEQVYGPRINAEVAYELVRESFLRANQEHNLAAVAEPRVEEADPIKKGQPVKFAAIIEVRGEVIDPQTEAGVRVESIDEDLRQIVLKHVKARAGIHPRSLVPKGIIGQKEQEGSLLRIAKWVADNGIDADAPEFRAARDLLLRAHPRVGQDPLAAAGAFDVVMEELVD